MKGVKVVVSILLIFALLMPVGVRAETVVVKSKLKKMEKIAVMPFCPVKSRKNSEKYKIIGKAAAYFTNVLLEKKVQKGDYDVTVLSYSRLRAKLKERGYSYKCYKKKKLKWIGKKIKADTIIRGTILKLSSRNEDDFYYIKTRIRFKVYRKGKLIAAKTKTIKMEIDAKEINKDPLVRRAIREFNIPKKYRKYLPAVRKASYKFVKWFRKYLPE